MITSNYVSSNGHNQVAPASSANSLENQQASRDGGSGKLGTYLNETTQNVHDLKNTSESRDEAPFYYLRFSIGDGPEGYSVMAQVAKVSEQENYPGFDGPHKSRIYRVTVLSNELAADFPELTGRPLVIEIGQGIDSRLGVQMGLQTLLEDAKKHRGNLGYEQRTGAQVSQTEEGYEAHPIGGKDGFPIPHIKMPGGGFPLN